MGSFSCHWMDSQEFYFVFNIICNPGRYKHVRLHLKIEINPIISEESAQYTCIVETKFQGTKKLILYYYYEAALLKHHNQYDHWIITSDS